MKMFAALLILPFSAFLGCSGLPESSATSGDETSTFSSGGLTSAILGSVDESMPAPPPANPSCSPSTRLVDIVFADPDLKACALYNTTYTTQPNGDPIVLAGQLTTLYCPNSEGSLYFDISDLGGIECLSNLQFFSIGSADGSTGVIDLSPVSHLSSLEYIALNGPRFNDLTPLASLPNFRGIGLDRTEVEDLEPLVGTGLMDITITEHEKPYSLEPLSRIPSFNSASVGLRGNVYYQSKLAEVLRLPNLRNLYISVDYRSHGVWGGSIVGIETATQLESLGVGGDVPIDASRVSGLTNLKGLSFDYWNTIRPTGDISGLAGLTNLEYLSIPNANVRDISPLAGMTRLQSLNLYQNQIRDVRVIGNFLPNLEQVDLHDNQIEKLTGFSNLTNLHSLNLEQNRLNDLSPIMNLGNIQSLGIYNNPTIPCPQLEQIAHVYSMDPNRSLYYGYGQCTIPTPPSGGGKRNPGPTPIQG